MEAQSPTVITERRTKEFWQEKDFWRDKNPLPIDEAIESMLDLYPSPGQYEVLYALAGHDPYDWDKQFQQYVIGIGQGGGKNTYIISPYLWYLTYKIANMTDPHKYFQRFFATKFPTTKKFEMSNSSMVSERQAKNVHFNKMMGLIKKTKSKSGQNWFERYAGMDLRSGFGDIKAKEIHIPTNPECGAIIHHSFDSTYSAWEGLDLLVAINDEPSRADTQATYLDAQKNWTGQIGNLNTRYPQNVGKVIAFSYLNNSEWDLTYTLIKQAEEEERLSKIDPTIKRVMYYIVKSSFEMNPNTRRDDPSIQAAYRTDPSDARARYEGIKGASREGFYQPHPEKVREMFYTGMSPVQYDYKITTREIVNPSTKEVEKRNYIGIDLTTIQGDNRIRGLAYDPAEKYDAFVLKMGYIETMDEMKEELFIENRAELVVINKRPIVDIVIVWQPQKGLTIDYLNIGEVIGILLDKFPNTRFAKSDKYNSAKLSQEIIARGVYSETLGFSNAMQMKLGKILRWMVWSNIPRILYDTSMSLIRKGITKTVGEWNALEHEQLIKINDNKIDHPADGGKDLFDSDSLLINELAKIEAIGGATATGIQSMTDAKIIALAEKYLIERQVLRNSGVHERDHLSKIAEAMKLSVSDTEKLKDYVEQVFPNL
jgi:hypothetical protein